MPELSSSVSCVTGGNGLRATVSDSYIIRKGIFEIPLSTSVYRLLSRVSPRYDRTNDIPLNRNQSSKQ